MPRPPELPPVFRLVLGLYARRLGLTFEAFEAMATGRAPWPPGVYEAILSTFEPLPQLPGLPSSRKNDTLVTVNASSEVAAPRLGRPPREAKHPFVAALRRKGVTFGEVAKDLGRSPASVKSWCRPKGDRDARPIPRDAAVALRARFGVPLTAWARVGD